MTFPSRLGLEPAFNDLCVSTVIKVFLTSVSRLGLELLMKRSLLLCQTSRFLWTCTACFRRSRDEDHPQGLVRTAPLHNGKRLRSCKAHPSCKGAVPTSPWLPVPDLPSCEGRVPQAPNRLVDGPVEWVEQFGACLPRVPNRGAGAALAEMAGNGLRTFVPSTTVVTKGEVW